MNKTKKAWHQAMGLVLLVALILAVSLGFLISAEASTPFPDVPEGKWYTDAVQYCYQKGYVGGYENGTFQPNKKMTRAEMSVIMNKMLGLKESSINTFTDVPSGKWFTEPILHCVKAGVMSGLDSKTFGTTQTLTREQGAVVLAKAFGVEKISGRTSFADDATISGWAVESVKAMATKQLITGKGNNSFAPKDALTRAEMCQIIWAAEKRTDDNPPPSENPKPTDSFIPVVTDEDGTVRVGAVNNTTSKETWSALMQKYTAEYGQTKVKQFHVDNDNNQELLIRGDQGAGNEKLITYHNGTVSELPLNGAPLAYVPKGNAILVGEYEDGTYVLSIYTIKNGTWTMQVQGSFQDPPSGPQKDKDGNDVYVNYKWNGKAVTEDEFYLGLISSIDVMKLVTVEN